MKENPSSGQSYEQCTWMFTLFLRKNGQMCNYLDSWTVVDSLAGWSGTRKGHDLKVCDKEIWVKVCGWNLHSRRATTVKIFVSHVSLHRRVTSAEEAFTPQVDRMTCSEGTCLFAQPGVTQWAHEHSGRVEALDVIRGLSNMNFYSPGQPGNSRDQC